MAVSRGILARIRDEEPGQQRVLGGGRRNRRGQHDMMLSGKAFTAVAGAHDWRIVHLISDFVH
jgi:hypothetical protein